MLKAIKPSIGLNEREFNLAVAADRLESARRFLPTSARWSALGLLCFGVFDWLVQPDMNAHALLIRGCGAIFLLLLSAPIKRTLPLWATEVLLCIPPLVLVATVSLASHAIQPSARDFYGGIALMLVISTAWLTRKRTYVVTQTLSLLMIVLIFWRGSHGADFRNLMFTSVFAIFCGLLFFDLLFRMNRRALRLQLELKTESRTDTLTHLPNRRAFLEHAENSILRARRLQHAVAILLIDADRFKSVNDGFGHDVGDKVLQTLASVIGNTLGSPRHCGRLGGEEFAILLGLEFADQITPELAESIAQRITDEVRKYDWQAENLPAMTLSIGIAFESAPKSLPALMRRADVALYQAKTNGRDRVEMIAGIDDRRAGA